MENPVFEGNVTGFLYSWATIENGSVVPHDGSMAFLWGNYSYRLFDMVPGDVYFTTRDAPAKGIILNSHNPFYLVNLEGARPVPYNIWSKHDINVTNIRIIEGSQKYHFISGELASSVTYAWNEIETQYTPQIESITRELNNVQYNTIRVFIHPFWSESNETVRIVVQKVNYYEGMLGWYIPPIYLLTACFVFDRYGEFVETYIVPPSMIANF
jgi:hypothetical protein